MKRFLYITVTVLAISAPLVYFLFIKENRDKIMTAIQNHGTTIAVHRVNIPEKISDIQQLSLSNIEIDVFNDNGILTVGHEKETSSNNSLLEYFEIINTKIPDFNFIWLDMKDLNKASEDLHISTLEQINNLYNIKNRVLIESKSPEALEKLSLQGWETGYYLRYELSDQPIEYTSQVIDDLNKYKISAITFPCEHLPYAITNFGANITLENSQKIDLNCWTFKRKGYTNDDYDLLANIKYLLMSIKTPHNL